MPRSPIWLVILAVLIVGTPVVAMLLDVTMGPWSASAIEHDGTVTHMVFDRNLPRPGWLAVLPGASIVQASRVVNAQQRRDVQSLSLSTHESLSDIRAFYRERLSRAGFAVTDLGTRPMNARTASFIGVADVLSATRTGTGDSVAITIHTPEGLFATRLIELRWAKAAARKNEHG
jgi:hypothetical protein